MCQRKLDSETMSKRKAAEPPISEVCVICACVPYCTAIDLGHYSLGIDCCRARRPRAKPSTWQQCKPSTTSSPGKLITARSSQRAQHTCLSCKRCTNCFRAQWRASPSTGHIIWSGSTLWPLAADAIQICCSPCLNIQTVSLTDCPTHMHAAQMGGPAACKPRVRYVGPGCRGLLDPLPRPAS